MPIDLDIYRSAKQLIDLHGADASVHAAMRADELLDCSDLDGQRVWLRIFEAVREFLRDEPRDNEAVH